MLNKTELDKGFWYLIENYNLDKLGITNITNGHKMEFPISNIFQWLVNSSIFCIQRKELITCLNCGFKAINEYFLNPLISIYIKNINAINLCEILNRLKEPSCGSCETCSYVGEKIKKNIFYETCKQKIIQNLSLPDFLFFIFDLSNENDLDNKQYENLVDLKNNYKHLIEEKFIYENFEYDLIGTLNQSSFDCYTSCIINNCFENNKLILNKNYFYDGFHDNNKINEIRIGKKNNIIDSIIDYHPLILLYVKLNKK